jgi:hypothetical protein
MGSPCLEWKARMCSINLGNQCLWVVHNIVPHNCDIYSVAADHAIHQQLVSLVLPSSTADMVQGYERARTCSRAWCGAGRAKCWSGATAGGCWSGARARLLTSAGGAC